MNDVNQIVKTQPELLSQVRDTMYRHVDGVAVGSTIVALADHNIFTILEANPGISMDQLQPMTGANAGYLHVALRLLAGQGWLTRSGEPGTGTMGFTLTPAGLQVGGQASAYRQAVETMIQIGGSTRAKDPSGFGSLINALDQATEKINKSWGLPEHGIPLANWWSILTQLNGHVAIPVLSWLTINGWGISRPLDPDSADPEWRPLLESALRLLESLGWAEGMSLTSRGTIAMARARQYWHPMCYMETLSKVEQLLFGDPSIQRLTEDGEESHIDRAMDIAFSGSVFNATCRSPFLELIRGFFDDPGVQDQPLAVVDVGCGNGSLLVSLYEYVKNHTIRGGVLQDFPLVMVGVEPSSVARETSQIALQNLNIPNIILDGNIDNPDEIARNLSARGLDPRQVLYVSKSVIHNRPYSSPRSPANLPATMPTSTGAFAHVDGSTIANPDLQQNLVEHFISWRGVSQKYGMVVIEAHIASPEVSEGLIGQSASAILDATHGYSNQFPVEAEVFLACAREAGYTVVSHQPIGINSVGYPALSINHFKVE